MRLPFLVLLLFAAPALAADPPGKPYPGVSQLDQALRQLKEKLTRSQQSSQIRGMTLPSHHYLRHYPTYFPPDQPSVVPELVVPPEPVKYRDPPASRKVKEDPNPLLGTWVRDIPGIRVTLKFTEKRLFATLQMAKKPEGKDPVETGAINLDADYGVGPGGRVFGVVTGVDVTASEEAFAKMGSGADSMQSAFDELLFTFRSRAEDDTLTVAGLKAEGVKEVNGFLPLLLGKFRRADGSPLPPIKPTKIEYQASGMTLPSPNDLKHYPTYFPPEPSNTTTGQIIGGMLGAGAGGIIGAATGNPKTEDALRQLRREEAPSPRELPVATEQDNRLTDEVSKKLEGNPATAGAGLRISANDGVVTVIGTVEGDSKKNAILDVVRYVPGVKQVRDGLEVSAIEQVPPKKRPTIRDLSVKLRGSQPPAQFICIVDPIIIYQPDTTRNGQPSPLLLGKVYLFGADQKPVDADGQLTVVLNDTTVRPPGAPQCDKSIVHIDEATLKRLGANDERFGRHYVVPLPWPDGWDDVTHVTVQARYSPNKERYKNAESLHIPESRLTVYPGTPEPQVKAQKK